MLALRLAALTGVLLLVVAGAAEAQRPSEVVAFVRDGDLVVLSLATGGERVVEMHVSGQVASPPADASSLQAARSRAAASRGRPLVGSGRRGRGLRDA